MVKIDANPEIETTIIKIMPFQGPEILFKTPLKYKIEEGMDIYEKTIKNIFNFL